jgi:hypothetical protein
MDGANAAAAALIPIANNTSEIASTREGHTVIRAQMTDAKFGNPENQAEFNSAGHPDGQATQQLVGDLSRLVDRIAEYEPAGVGGPMASDRAKFLGICNRFNRLAAQLRDLRMKLEGHPERYVYEMNIIYYVIGNNHEDRGEARVVKPEKTKKGPVKNTPQKPAGPKST